MKDLIRAIKKEMTSEVNDGEFYILNNKNRACTSDLSFTDDVGNETVKSFKTQASAEKFMSAEFKKSEIEEEGARVVNEKDVCSFGYYVETDENNKEKIIPVYTLNTLLNRATNERYHKNVMDAQAYVDDAPNREQRKATKKVESAITRIKAQAKLLGLTPEQLLGRS